MSWTESTPLDWLSKSRSLRQVIWRSKWPVSKTSISPTTCLMTHFGQGLEVELKQRSGGKSRRFWVSENPDQEKITLSIRYANRILAIDLHLEGPNALNFWTRTSNPKGVCNYLSKYAHALIYYRYSRRLRRPPGREFKKFAQNCDCFKSLVSALCVQ